LISSIPNILPILSLSIQTILIFSLIILYFLWFWLFSTLSYSITLWIWTHVLLYHSFQIMPIHSYQTIYEYHYYWIYSLNKPISSIFQPISQPIHSVYWLLSIIHPLSFSLSQYICWLIDYSDCLNFLLFLNISTQPHLITIY